MHWSINTPRWMGKAVGFTCAMLWAPTDPVWLPAGLIAGIALGHVYDIWGSAKSNPNLAGLRGHPGSATSELQFLFSAAGRISKASGTVQPAHIERAEQIIKALKLNNAGRAQAIAWFEQGKDPDTSFSGLAKQCLQAPRRKKGVRSAVVQCLCDFAVIEPSRACVAELKRLAAMLGYASGRVGQLFGEAHSRRTFRREPPGQTDTRSQHSGQSAPAAGASPPTAVSAAYRYLDIPADSNLGTAKQAYRRLVSRYHPDRLGADAGQQEISHAQRKMVELRDALETIEAYLDS